MLKQTRLLGYTLFCFCIISVCLCYNRYDMCPGRSVLLSTLLDEVTGTEEAINIRRDYTRIRDCVTSMLTPWSIPQYFTGSKAEGLYLPGSDMDYMYDINDMGLLKVIESESPRTNVSQYFIFYLCTDKTHPGFALLLCANPELFNFHEILANAIKLIEGQPYLSSDSFVDITFNLWNKIGVFRSMNKTGARQGPSYETWPEFGDKSIPGDDNVLSLHCDFWPTVASEWIKRSRQYGWPTSEDINSIVKFGFHLVPIGYPKSANKLEEWRLWFSIAERTLVWSFNHVQIQCYAIMKIILKGFIKTQCSSENQVLCSYFIKTFLFWKYEINIFELLAKEKSLSMHQVFAAWVLWMFAWGTFKPLFYS